MSGYSPFAWSFALSVLRSIREEKWTKERDANGALVARTNNVARVPAITIIGWVILRIVLAVDMALIYELVGTFVLNAVHYNAYDYKKTHVRSPEATAFISAFSGLVMGILLIIIDLLFSSPEKVEKPNATFLDPADRKRAKNYTEGGILTLRKLRVHAFMRLIIWPALACAGGASGTALWHLRQNDKPGNHAAQRAITGLVVELTGAAVVVVGPTLIQLLSLTVDAASPVPRKAT